VGAAGDLSRNGFDECRMGVAEEERAVAHDVIDDFVAVDVPLAGAGRVVDVDGEWLEVAEVVSDAVREVAAGAGVKLGRARVEGAVALEDRVGAGLLCRSCHRLPLSSAATGGRETPRTSPGCDFIQAC
jgi:hypothetical protein